MAYLCFWYGRTAKHPTHAVKLKVKMEKKYPPNLFTAKHGLGILKNRCFLCSAPFRCTTLSRQLENTSYTCKYLRHLRDLPSLPHQALGFPHHLVTTALADAMGFQLELEI